MTDQAFWLERWQSGEIGFHQSDPQDLLEQHWPSLGLDKGSSVFVPLCGKSIDMVWLAGQGHQVIGCELSPIAIADFFRSLNLRPRSTPGGDHGLICHQAGPYTLYEGNFFALTPGHVANVAAVYDRASLVAFPQTEQVRYIDHLALLGAASRAQVFLICLAFDQSQMAGPPFSIDSKRLTELTDGHFACRTIEIRDGLEQSDNLRKRGLTALEEAVYLLTPASSDTSEIG
jgi:thiopurine S-methyltransferase